MVPLYYIEQVQIIHINYLTARWFSRASNFDISAFVWLLRRLFFPGGTILFNTHAGLIDGGIASETLHQQVIENTIFQLRAICAAILHQNQNSAWFWHLPLFSPPLIWTAR